MNYTVGSDPEGFLVDTETGNFTPAFGLIGGDKDRPLDIGNGYAMLEDNVMVEYNIPPSQFGKNLKESIEFMTDRIRKHLKGRYDIMYIPSVEFTEEDLSDDKAFEFGCAPDYNVWTQDMRLLDTASTNWRFAGGHLHFGYEDPTLEMSAHLVKLFDLFMGVPSILIDSDSKRREMYGMAGGFRHTSYGFEYRTLSNFWVNSLEDWVTHQIKQVVENINLDVDSLSADIQIAINMEDKDLANKLIKKYNIRCDI